MKMPFMPMSDPQKCTFPSAGFIWRPVISGNQKSRPATIANSVPGAAADFLPQSQA
jgi:hypothetical protein